LLHVEDRVSMAASLESRVPILDTRIMEIVASAPPAMKFQGGETKALLKRAIQNVVPTSILNRKDKMGFPVPLSEWMKGGVVRDFVNDTLLSQASYERGLYRKESLKNMANSQGVGSRQLWGALNLELWHRQFIDAH
jgi:asparagine synthase (glutamine-hydrolysing)